MEPHYAPRTIAFQSEILHPLVEADPARLQRLHNHLFEAGQPPYSDFAVLQDGVMFSNPASRPGAISSVAISSERLLFREELTAMTVDEFAVRVRKLSEQVCELLGIQVLTAHQVTLRTLANPRHFVDSREYIKSGMFGFSDETEDFGREPQLLGLRLVFPPSEGEPNAHALRIELRVQAVHGASHHRGYARHGGLKRGPVGADGIDVPFERAVVRGTGAGVGAPGTGTLALDPSAQFGIGQQAGQLAQLLGRRQRGLAGGGSQRGWWRLALAER